MEMNPHTDTPRTDAFVAENSLLAYSDDKYELTLVHARQLERELNEAEAEVERLRELMSRFCESVAENWDEGIADYFMDEMNKTYKEIHPQHK